jgi:peptide/nickel transport system substrate-binding protein
MVDRQTRRDTLRLLAVSGGAGLAGCSGGDQSTTPTEHPSETDDGTEQQTGEETDGGTLVLRATQKIDTLDPRLSELAWYGRLGPYLFDSLLLTSPDGTEQVPHLAAEPVEEVDEKTYVARLREDVTFHDGTPMTAEDVKYTFEWILDPENESPIRSNLGWIESVSVTDTHEVTISASSVFPLALATLASGISAIVPKETVEQMDTGEFGQNPVGTGPFEFAEHVPGERIELTAYSDYFLGEPALDGLVFQIVPDDKAAIDSLASGSIHESQVSLAQLERARSIESISLTFLSDFDHNGFAFNCLDGPFTDRRAREALHHLVDYDELMREAVAELGRRTAGYLPMEVNEVWGFPAERWFEEYYPPQDRDRALELFDAAGLGTDFSVTLVSLDTAQWLEKSRLLKQELEAVGVDVTLESVSVNEWLERLNSGAHDITTYRWTGGTDPDGFYYYLFRDLANDEGGTREGVVGNASAGYIYEASRGTSIESELQAMDEHIRAARQTTDSSERYDHYVNVADTIQRLYVGMPIYAEDSVVGIHETVDGYERTAYSSQEAHNYWTSASLE